MTKKEIQAVIDKGGYLVRFFDKHTPTSIFKPISIKDRAVLYRWWYGMVINKTIYYSDSYPLSDIMREATPEEIERFVK